MSDEATDARDDGGSQVLSPVRALLALVAFLAALLVLGAVGVPFDTGYRICCAAVCLWFIHRLQKDLPEARWLWVGLGLSALVNVALFFTPVVDRPSSRGELMLFAIPDLVVVLAARIATLRPVDVDGRAKRLQLIVFLVLASAACAGLLWAAVAESHGVH